MFLKQKSDLPEMVTKWAVLLEKETGISIKSFRLDNSGENIKLQELTREHPQLKIKFEFTAPGTPQQNGKVERMFATLYGKIRSVLNSARLTTGLRKGLWAQCANHAVQIQNILIMKHGEDSASERFYGRNPSWINNMRTFGEMAIVTDHQHKKMRGKLDDRGYPCIFIGYTEDHAHNVFKFLNIKTRQLIMSRDVTWLNQTYAQYFNIRQVKEESLGDQVPYNGQDHDYSDDSEDALGDFGISDLTSIDQEGPNAETLQDDIAQDADVEDQLPPPQALFQTPVRQRRRTELELLASPSLYDEKPSRRVTRSMSQNIMTEQQFGNSGIKSRQEYAMICSAFCLIAGFDDGSDVPKSYRDVIGHKSEAKWWDAMKDEFKAIEVKEVWDIVAIDKVPSGRKLIGNRWVFNEKDDGRFRARTVAQGFSQVPGKDFQESHAPVVNDVTFRITLILRIMKKFNTGQFDIETAFLYSNLEEEIWMKLPEAYSRYMKEIHNKDYEQHKYCVKLKKALYGLVQAARQWWKKFTEAMATCEYFPTAIDPCLFI
jgi:hypothetical protein